VPPFDLVVIDEAHEIFAGLHKRYGRDGIYDDASEEAMMAHRVRGFLRSSPVLLLTAASVQNSLAELWGLVQYVEPTGTLLDDITTFRQVLVPRMTGRWCPARSTSSSDASRLCCSVPCRAPLTRS
jgi:hypothetical protein